MPFNRHAVHNGPDEATEELAASFAAGSLGARERAEYVEHIRGCAVCRTLAAEMQGVAAALPYTLEPVQASAGLKARVLAVAQGSAKVPDDVRPGPAPEDSPPLRYGRRSMDRAMQASLAAAAVFALAFAGVLVWSLFLRSDNREQGGRLADQARLLDAIAAGGTVTHLQGTDAEPAASAAVVQPTDGGDAVMLVRNLPALPADQAYQVWRIEDSVPVGAGMFAATGAEEQLVVLAADFSGADAIGVSVEPEGGSLTPTGAIVLLGSAS